MTRIRSKTWHAREALRHKGQFWTPAWVARAMVRYATTDGPALYDAGVGAGAFAAALHDIRPTWSLAQHYRGAETDPDAIGQAIEAGIPAAALAGVEQRDFIGLSTLEGCTGIVSNPPYVRHHRMDAARKQRLRRLAAQEAGLLIDGRAGLHVYFLIHALHLLPAGGRLAFIVPSDVVEGVFARGLWRWIADHYRVDACIRFAADATPFPGVDTNPVVVLIRRAAPSATFMQAMCRARDDDALDRWIHDGMPACNSAALNARAFAIHTAVQRGFGRDLDDEIADSVPLSAFASTLRGIATGDNGFFFLDRATIQALELPRECFVRAVGKTADVSGDCLREADLDELDAVGRPTWLLSLTSEHAPVLGDPMRRYLARGEAQGLPDRALISQRRPWYKMEVRRPPAFLFTYLGRRSARFVRNLANAVPLTGFICVYPHDDSPAYVDALWRSLSDPETLANLKHVGKSYGSGAIKVEPRALANLPIPRSVLARHGLRECLLRRSSV